MPVRQTRQGQARWARAAVWSLAAHTAVLGVLWVFATLRPAPAAEVGGIAWPVAELEEAATAVDLAAVDEVVPVSAAPAAGREVQEDPPVPSAPWRPGDQTTEDRSARLAPTDGEVDRRAPAPDRGAGSGRALDQRPWRRDASTLRERAADGAEVDQPAHARTARFAGSEQAVRREPRVGVGDSTRNERAVTAPLPGRYTVTDPAADGVGGETREADVREQVPASTAAIPVAAHSVLASAEGPLDAEEGTRSFDVERRARGAADDHATRAASTAAHPSITDLTLASVSGNTREGHGPSDMPGAVTRATAGPAPAVPGTRAAALGTNDAAAAHERVYDRYNQEIRARVYQALVWPRALAIRLEQGETVLRFVVQPDGRLADDVRVVKSSGFIEFDQAALDAVRKASPFPPMTREARLGPLTVNLRVPFSNPVIR